MSMTEKSVFIVSSYRMFGLGLESMLGQNETIEIVGQEATIDRAIEQIDQLAPDVVILDGDEPPYDSVAIILAILKAQSISKIIGLNLQNNNLRIFEARQWVARSVEDLVAAIQNGPPKT
jgi:DNA-binding NarL/FixJ family response regulator